MTVEIPVGNGILNRDQRKAFEALRAGHSIILTSRRRSAVIKASVEIRRRLPEFGIVVDPPAFLDDRRTVIRMSRRANW